MASSTEALAFFDLSGSTSLKLTKGHLVGTDVSLRFMRIAADIVTATDGRVVQELGDGVLCRFPDPRNACRAALNIKRACYDLAISSSAGLTVGLIDTYMTASGQEAIMGAAVDRCARIQSVAYPGQILLDEALYEIVRSHFLHFHDVALSNTFHADVKGIGDMVLRELAKDRSRFVNQIVTPFQVHAAGRLSIEEKVRFVNTAMHEVIEIGTGLTTFAKYFTGQKPKEFQHHIRDLLRRGVSVKCYAVDPAYDAAALYLRDQGDNKYAGDLERARDMILKERRQFLSHGMPGTLEYYRYRLAPQFHCICVDAADRMNGKILFSPYLPGVTRSEAPVYQVSAVTDPELFSKYVAGVRAVEAASEEIRA
jgi:class 3 adenylate cyclase